MNKCKICNKDIKSWNKYCSRICYYKTISKRTSGKNNPMWEGGKIKRICQICGKIFYIDKARLKRKNGGLYCSMECLGISLMGEKSPHWIIDRNELQRYNDDAKDRRSYTYSDWRKRVWIRDNFKCRIANTDCDGRIEAHHILGWTEYVELRYEINNGITLCHAHHPIKRAEEKRLIPVFRELVSVSKG